MRKWSLQIFRWTFLASSLTMVIPASAVNQQAKDRFLKATQIPEKNRQNKMNTVSSMITMDYASYLAPIDLHFTKPTKPIEGIPLGNGKIGSLVWIDQTGSSIHLNIGRNDVFYRGSATTTWTGDSHLDGNSKVGHIVINFPGNPFATKAIQHLDTYNGYERIQGQDVSAKIVAWEDKDVFCN